MDKNIFSILSTLFSVHAERKACRTAKVLCKLGLPALSASIAHPIPNPIIIKPKKIAITLEKISISKKEGIVIRRKIVG